MQHFARSCVHAVFFMEPSCVLVAARQKRGSQELYIWLSARKNLRGAKDNGPSMDYYCLYCFLKILRGQMPFRGRGQKSLWGASPAPLLQKASILLGTFF